MLFRSTSGGTVSGSWTLGGASGPTSITVCGSTTQGNIVITTGSSNVAGSVSAGGSVSLTLGSGNQSAGPTALPSNNNIQGLAYDANTGYIYASDQSSNQIWRFKQNQPFSVFAGVAGNGGFSGDGGPAINAQFNQPGALWMDSSSNVYVVDTKNYRIRMIAPSGTITTVAGN